MGLLTKVKGFLNIGGASLSITQVENPFHQEDSVMQGKYTLTSKSEKTVLSYQVEFYSTETEGRGEDKKVTRKTIAKFDSKKDPGNTEFPFDLAAGDVKEMDFCLTGINMHGAMGRLAEKEGMMGAIGKAGKLMGKMQQKGIMQYFVEVTADVKGTPMDPSDKFELTIVPGKS